MNFSISQITPKLISERLRGYKLILGGQIIILINSLVVFEFFKRYNFNHWQLRKKAKSDSPPLF